MASVVSGPGGLGRPPVMADVARLAGVSHQTVSRVLNNHPNVRPPTRERVLAAIRELAYRPNAAARTLVTRRTHTLGVISFDTMLYGPASMLYGFERPRRSPGRGFHDHEDFCPISRGKTLRDHGSGAPVRDWKHAGLRHGAGDEPRSKPRTWRDGVRRSRHAGNSRYFGAHT